MRFNHKLIIFFILFFTSIGTSSANAFQYANSISLEEQEIWGKKAIGLEFSNNNEVQDITVEFLNNKFENLSNAQNINIADMQIFDQNMNEVQINNLNFINLKNNDKLWFVLKSSKAYIPGIYTLPLRIKYKNHNGLCHFQTYPLALNLRPYQELQVESKHLELSVKQDKLFNLNHTQDFKKDLNIIVKSNTPWKLLMIKNTNEKDIDYQFKVNSNNEQVKSEYKNYTDLNQKVYVIAQGNPTINRKINQLEKSPISLNYRVRTNNQKIQKAGTYNCSLKFKLIESN